MAFETCNYGGLIPDLKNDYINLNLLFNVMDRNSDSKTSNFKVATKGVVNKGDGAIGVCNAIPIRCSDANQFDVTADFPVSVNELFDDCIEKTTREEYLQVLNQVAREWGYIEATHAYNNQNPLLTDLTAEIKADPLLINIYDKITYGVKHLVSLGYNAKDLIVAVSETGYYELQKMDISCCDFEVQTAETGQIIGNKLGVKRITYVPLNVLSGNIDDEVLTPETSVLFEIYLQDFSMLKTYCEDLPVLRDITDLEYAGTRSQIIGKEYMGHGYYDPASGVIMYEAEITTPATGTLVAGTPTSTTIPFTYTYDNGTELASESYISIAPADALDIEPATVGVGVADEFTGLNPSTSYDIRLFQGTSELSVITVSTTA